MDVGDKGQMIEIIKEWIDLEKELQALNSEIREKRKQKIMSQAIVEIMKKNELDTIDTNSGKIIYSQRKTKKALNQNKLLALIGEHSGLSEEQCKTLTDEILNNREISLTDVIKFKSLS